MSWSNASCSASSSGYLKVFVFKTNSVFVSRVNIITFFPLAEICLQLNLSEDTFWQSSKHRFPEILFLLYSAH